MGLGPLFEELADKTATFTYAQRIWLFFKGLFEISFSKIFELFEIEDDFQSFIDTLNQSVSRFAPIKGLGRKRSIHKKAKSILWFFLSFFHSYNPD